MACNHPIKRGCRQYCSATATSTVPLSACKDAANGDPNIHYNFCVSSLNQNPKSTNASLTGLFRISMGLAISNATKIKSRISKTLTGHQNLSNHAMISLKTCSAVYSSAISHLATANAASKAKDYFTANIRISAAVDAPQTCQQAFEDEGEPCTLPIENNNFFELSAIALCFSQQVAFMISYFCISYI